MDTNKKNLFSLGSFSKKDLILFLLCPLSYSLNNKLSNENFINRTQTFKYYSIFFGYILIGIIFFIIHKINYFESKINEFNKSNYFNIFGESFKKVIIILFLISILDILSTYIFTFSSKFSNFQIYLSYLYPLTNITFWILSKLMIKFDLYTHHYVSIIIISIGLIIINLININLNIDIILIICLLLLQYIYPLIDIIAFHLLYENEMEFYLFILIIGINGVLFGLLFSILSFNNIYLIQIDIFRDYDIKQLPSFLLFSITNGITYSLIFLIFKLFKPWFYGVTAVINSLITFLLTTKLTQSNINNNIIIIIIYIILIFQCLIFNEQIICNFWGLNKNTKFKISLRGENEIIELFHI